jgi:membrane protein implicated in regulation of membrane protease activity
VIILGVVLLVAAAAATVIVIVQNRGSVVDVHVLGQTWSGHVYWVLVAGLIIAVAALLGLAVMRVGVSRARRQRRERAELIAENQWLSERVRDPETTSFFAGEAAAADTTSPDGDRSEETRLYRRGQHFAS